MIQNVMTDLIDMLEKIYLKNLIQEDLTLAESIALHVVYQLHSPTIIELATALQISQSNATYLIHKLIDHNYIERRRSSEDRREFHLEVTDKFNEQLNSNRENLAATYEEVLDLYPGEQQEVIQSFYKNLIQKIILCYESI